MTAPTGERPVELVLDPYDYEFHEDPYPYYKRLRDEAPLYHNAERGFWALTRHADVHKGFRNSTALSNKLGVALDPISRTPEAHRTMSLRYSSVLMKCTWRSRSDSFTQAGMQPDFAKRSTRRSRRQKLSVHRQRG